MTTTYDTYMEKGKESSAERRQRNITTSIGPPGLHQLDTESRRTFFRRYDAYYSELTERAAQITERAAQLTVT